MDHAPPPTPRSRASFKAGGSIAAVPDARRPIALQLDAFGPGFEGRVPVAVPDECVRYARELAEARRENFTVLSSLVPRDLRDDFASVYAFCRWADDLGDEAGESSTGPSPGRGSGPSDRERTRATRLELLGWWRGELSKAVQGQARHPVMIALGQTITRRRLDPAPFHRLIDAFELDQRRDEHVTWRELVSYCERSANPVGEIVLNLGGVFRDSHPALLAMSDDACTALQITNHLQDLRSDLLDRGRLYIPSEVTGLGRAELLTLAKMSGAGAEGANARERTRLALSPVWERASSLYQRARSLPRLVGQTPAARLAPLVWLLVAGGRRTHGLLAQRGLCGLWRRERLARPQAGLLILGAIARRAVWRARVSPAPRPIGATA